MNPISAKLATTLLPNQIGFILTVLLDHVPNKMEKLLIEAWLYWYAWNKIGGGGASIYRAFEADIPSLVVLTADINNLPQGQLEKVVIDLSQVSLPPV